MSSPNTARAGDDRLNLLYLADIRFPLERANGIQTFETCHALATRGLGVRLFVRDDTIRPRRDPFEFYGLPRVAALRIDRLLMAGPHPARRAWYLAAAVWAAMRAPRRGCVFTRDLGVADAIAALPRATRPPLVYESHGFAPVFSRTMPELVSGTTAGGDRKIRRLFRREQRVWRRSEGYVTTTGVLAAEMRTRFGDRSHLATIPNGVRLPANRPSTQAPRTKSTLVAYAGHLYPWKGVDVLIRALRQLPSIHALIVGGLSGEPDLERIRTLARELDVDRRVRFSGQVEPSRVPDLLKEAAILVLPTVATASAAYTSPLKLFEYFAAGKPVVASDLPPIREVVRDGENGLLFVAGSPDSLACAIRRLEDDKPLADALAERAIADVEQYSWCRRAERLEAFLMDVVRGRAPIARTKGSQ